MTGKFNDEIDLLIIIKKIWKWKWLVITISIIPTLILLIYMKLQPADYIVISKIKIGKIGGIYIENDYNIDTFINDKLKSTVECTKIKNNSLDIKFKKTEHSKSIDYFFLKYIELSFNTRNPHDCIRCLKIIDDALLIEHDTIYKKGLMEIHNSINNTRQCKEITPKYFLKAYNYPSDYISKPQIIKKQPINARTIFLFSTAFFILGIFISLFVDYSILQNNNNK